MKRIKRVSVIGAGTMGRQISLQVARHGLPVAAFTLILIRLMPLWIFWSPMRPVDGFGGIWAHFNILAE